MCININDYGEFHYVKKMVEIFNDNTPDAKYLGVISYSKFVNNKPRNIQPVFIWTKNIKMI